MKFRAHPTQLRSLWLATVVATFAFAPVSANTRLDAMWSETQATVLRTPQQTSFIGGDLSVRVPVRTYQLLNVDPPRFSAGCGGIDAHFGSFSFISADAFKDLLRKVAQAAPGYFLHLAINSMCNPCSQLLSWFQDLTAKLNSAAMNSCSLAKGLVNDLVKGFADPDSKLHKAATAEGTRSVFDGSASDWFSGLWTHIASLPEKLASGTPAEKRDSLRKTEGGNVLVRAGVLAAAHNRVEVGLYGIGGSGNYRPFYELMINVFGTNITDLTPVSTSSAAMPSAKSTVVRGGLSLDNLRNGPIANGSDREWSTCEDWQDNDDLVCVNVRADTQWSSALSTRNAFPGAKALVHQTLFGSSNPENYQITDNSLLGLLRSGASLNNNLRYRQFLGIMPPGAHYALMEVKHNPNALAAVGREIEGFMVDALTIAIASDLLRIYDRSFTQSHLSKPSSFDGSTDIPLPTPEPHMNENAARLKNELAQLQTMQAKNFEKMGPILAWSKDLRAMTMRSTAAPRQ